MVSNILLNEALAFFDNFRGCYSLDEIEQINPWGFGNVSSFVINTFEKKDRTRRPLDPSFILA